MNITLFNKEDRAALQDAQWQINCLHDDFAQYIRSTNEARRREMQINYIFIVLYLIVIAYYLFRAKNY